MRDKAHRLLSALWLGGGVFLIAVAAPAAFRAAPNSIAADVVGAMLIPWHYLALVIPILLMIVNRQRMTSMLLALLTAAIILATAQGITDVAVRLIRQRSFVPISSLDRSDPVRRRFGMLHGLSSMLLLAQVIVAAAVTVRETR